MFFIVIAIWFLDTTGSITSLCSSHEQRPTLRPQRRSPRRWRRRRRKQRQQQRRKRNISPSLLLLMSDYIFVFIFNVFYSFFARASYILLTVAAAAAVAHIARTSAPWLIHTYVRVFVCVVHLFHTGDPVNFGPVYRASECVRCVPSLFVYLP